MPGRRIVAATPDFELSEGVGRAFDLSYISNDRTTTMEAELGAGKRIGVFPVTCTVWESEHGTELVTTAERALIVDRIRAVYEGRGWAVDIVPPAEADWEYYLSVPPGGEP